jgi:hypothetical protein
MALVRVEPMGQLTHKVKWVSKNPHRKIIWHLGVELTSPSMLSSQSTSESHRRKIETATEMKRVTEKIGRTHSPMVQERRSIEISRKWDPSGVNSNSSPSMSEDWTRSPNRKSSMTWWSTTDLKWSASARPSCKAHSS